LAFCPISNYIYAYRQERRFKEGDIAERLDKLNDVGEKIEVLKSMEHEILLKDKGSLDEYDRLKALGYPTARAYSMDSLRADMVKLQKMVDDLQRGR
jgi:hypothetical protein